MKNASKSAASEAVDEDLSYIIDEPAEEDRFGAHSAIADAIIAARTI